MKFTRLATLRLASTSLPLLLLADGGLNDFVRRAVVRGAQQADALDGVWQQFSGEVVPGWRDVKDDAALGLALPATRVDAALAAELLDAPLRAVAAAKSAERGALDARVPAAAQQALVLYPETFARPLGECDDLADPACFAFKAFANWRVAQDELAAAERPRFGAALGEALLAGALKPANRGGSSGGELPRALEDMEGVLQRLRDGGVIASFELTGGQRDRVAEEWEDAPPGASVGWTYLVSGCVLSRVSQLAEARAATLSPAQLVTAPLAAVLAATRGVEQPLVALYFIDPRGRPDPRTFSDPTFYTQLLLEVTARKGG